MRASTRPLPNPLRRLLVGLAVVASIAGAAAAVAGCSPPPPTVVELERHAVLEPLDRFVGWWLAGQAARHGVSASEVRRWWDQAPQHLDDVRSRRGRWDLSTDLCSRVPDRGRTFDFRPACIRHDFGWRNAPRVTRDHAVRQRLRHQADGRFLADMRTLCARRPVRDRLRCRAVALAYYLGVEVVT